MAEFQAAHKIVMANEGGYTPGLVGDSGGETYKGVSRKNFPDWTGWQIIDAVKRTLPPKMDPALQASAALQVIVLQFYKKEFWDELNLDQVGNQAIATELYDTAVNMGTGTSALFLQRALNVSSENGVNYPFLKLDAKIGPNTTAVLNNHKDPADVLKVLNVLQGAKYIGIMEANPSQERFFRSWFSRVSL